MTTWQVVQDEPELRFVVVLDDPASDKPWESPWEFTTNRGRATVFHDQRWATFWVSMMNHPSGLHWDALPRGARFDAGKYRFRACEVPLRAATEG